VASDDDRSNITSAGSAPQDRGAESPAGFLVVDRPDLLQPVRVADVELAPDPARPGVVTAEFWNGDHRSYGAKASVTETSAEVRVEVFVGVLPDADDQPAAAVAERQRLEIGLGSPLGGRRLVAG
jgi:hypothetical protein